MKRIVSLLLSVLMLVGCCAMTVSADSIYNDTTLEWTDGIGAFVVENVDAIAGETVVVPVCVENNPGIVSLKLAVSYDVNVLELVEVIAGDFVKNENHLSFGPRENTPFIINWINALSVENVTTNGVVAYLTFYVKPDAEGVTEIALNFDANDVFDVNYQNVEFICAPGTVTIASENILYGDVNEDGKVNVRDLGTMSQYLNKWGVTLNLKAADLNADGNVNMRDLALLQRYLNGWDVELGPQEPPAEPVVELPAVGYDMDGKGRILVQSSEVITVDGVRKASLVFVNVSKQNGKEWIIPEYSRMDYACYDAEGNALTTGTAPIGALEGDANVACLITLPEGTVRVAITGHNLEYWTPWV